MKKIVIVRSRFSKSVKTILIIGICCISSFYYGAGIYKGIIKNHDYTTPIVYSGGDRINESLDRGLVALYHPEHKVYLSWRLFHSDPKTISFNVYQVLLPNAPMKLNTLPIDQTTDFLVDNCTDEENIRFFIRAVINNTEQEESKWVSILGDCYNPYISIPLAGMYSASRVGIADLDGDMCYDFVIKHPVDTLDPLYRPFNFNRGWHESYGTYKIEAYASNFSNGTKWYHIWTNDLGWNIEQGIWFSPYIVYDLDGDGFAEIAVKTGDPIKDYRRPGGRVLTGPEYVSILNGRTGEQISQQDWLPRSFQIYNFYSRNQMGIAYIDGVHPSLLIERGTYAKMEMSSFRFNGTELEKVWNWNSRHEKGWKGYDSQGAHFLHSADVDGDLCDEIVLGTCTIDNTGVGLWNTGLGHPDHTYIGDIDPNRPGLEIYMGIEGKLAPFPEWKNGYCLVDAHTGEIVWGSNETTFHIHQQGLVADIDSNYPGMECFSGESNQNDRWLHSSNGTLIGDENTLDRTLISDLKLKAVYWDADPQRELLIGGKIFDFETKSIYTTEIPDNQIAWVDILGDWREEIIVSVNGELRIYMTTIPAVDRRVCLMQDSLYRLDIAHISMGYYQVPMTSYCLANHF